MHFQVPACLLLKNVTVQEQYIKLHIVRFHIGWYTSTALPLIQANLHEPLSYSPRHQFSMHIDCIHMYICIYIAFNVPLLGCSSKIFSNHLWKFFLVLCSIPKNVGSSPLYVPSPVGPYLKDLHLELEQTKKTLHQLPRISPSQATVFKSWLIFQICQQFC